MTIDARTLSKSVQAVSLFFRSLSISFVTKEIIRALALKSAMVNQARISAPVKENEL